MRYALIVVLISVLLLSGCSSSKPAIGNMPVWYENPPRSDDHLYAPSTATSRDIQMAVDNATLGGRGEIAQQLTVRFSGLTKRFQEEVGLAENSELLQQFTQTYRAVVDEVLIGSRAKEQRVIPEGNVYRAYVLMEMPIGAANQALMQKIRSQENLYTRFRATEAYKELEEEIEKYEEWKKRQSEGYRP